MKKTNKKQVKSSKTIWVAIVFFVLGAVAGVFVGKYFTHNAYTFATYECIDGGAPDKNGCCPGELYTDDGNGAFSCCPEAGGECFPPMR